MESISHLYKLLPQLPHIPDDICNSVDLNKKPRLSEMIGYSGVRKFKNQKGKERSAIRNIRVRNELFEQWVKSNIVEDIVEAGLNYAVCNNSNDEEHSTGVHSDGVRNFAVLYNIKTGGPTAKLCFWQEPGEEIVRSPKTKISPSKKLNYLGGLILPERTWCLIDARVLHSVEHMTSTRINFQISLNKHAW